MNTNSISLAASHKAAPRMNTDARWAKKNQKAHYGYKNHVLYDRKSKLVKDYVVTHAAVHDSCVIGKLVSSEAAILQTLYADSAYRSTDIESDLTECKIKSRVHYIVTLCGCTHAKS